MSKKNSDTPYKDIFDRICDRVEYCESCPIEKDCPKVAKDAELNVSTTGLPHYSHSQFFKFQMCGMNYKFHYIDKIKFRKNHSMVMGSSCHKGAQKNFGQKIESHEDLPVKEIVDQTMAYFDKNIKDAEVNFDDKGRNKKDVIGEKQDKTFRLMKHHIEKFSPDIMPVQVEQMQEIIIPGTQMSLLGKIDLVDSFKNIRDLKVTAKKKGQAEADSSLQLSIYWLLYLALFKEPPQSVILDCLIDYKSRGADVVSTQSTRTNFDMQRVVNLIYSIDENIKKGNFMPSSPEAWICSEKYCDYWFLCKHGGKHGGKAISASPER